PEAPMNWPPDEPLAYLLVGPRDGARSRGRGRVHARAAERRARGEVRRRTVEVRRAALRCPCALPRSGERTYARAGAPFPRFAAYVGTVGRGPRVRVQGDHAGHARTRADRPGAERGLLPRWNGDVPGRVPEEARARSLRPRRQLDGRLDQLALRPRPSGRG